MASFDFIESATKSYSYVWHNRKALIVPSLAVLGIKLLCLMTILGLKMDSNVLRHGLILIPSHFAEGWIIAHTIVQALRTESDKAYLVKGLEKLDIQKAVMASMIIYVLTKIVLSLIIGIPYAIDPAAMTGEKGSNFEGGGHIGSLIGASLIVLFMAWAFRFLWLYIPPLLNISLEAFLKRIKAIKTSFYMLALWVICFLPLLLIMVICIDIISLPFPKPPEGELMGMEQKYIVTFINAIFDYVIALITSIGMAYGIASIFNDENKTVSLW